MIEYLINPSTCRLDRCRMNVNLVSIRDVCCVIYVCHFVNSGLNVSNTWASWGMS
jgi:hypothetical protein